MATWTLTPAHFRDPIESAEILYAIEGPVEREGDEGFCYCSPARSNPWDDDSELFADAVAALADYAEIEVNQAAALIRDAHAKQPTELCSPHLQSGGATQTPHRDTTRSHCADRAATPQSCVNFQSECPIPTQPPGSPASGPSCWRT